MKVFNNDIYFPLKLTTKMTSFLGWMVSKEKKVWVGRAFDALIIWGALHADSLRDTCQARGTTLEEKFEKTIEEL